ncbi:sensor domain-containing diguanylate cyclase [Deinococcus ficus]|uniref:sensor domain-containing diguanylate cyclase n=1 Tax=Deinococcus ficus TaxID=317577 RepID=UPI0003B303AA|nr:diguanylate cyclase [Deinococcus ficus]
MTHSPRLPNPRAVLYGLLGLLALFSVVSNGLLVRSTAQIEREQALTAATSRQQRLAEQVLRHARQVIAAPVSQQARGDLQRSIATLQDGQRELTAAPEFQRATGDLPADQSLAAQLQLEVTAFSEAASAMLSPAPQLTGRPAALRKLERQLAGPLTAALDEADTLMRGTITAHIHRINTFAWLRLGSLVTLFGLAVLLIRPLERQVRRVQTDLVRERDFAQQVMTTVAQGLSVTDAEGRFEYVNPAYARLVGVTPQSLIGRTPFDITFEEDHAILTAAKAQRDTGLTSTYETRLKRTDGEAVHVLVSGAPRTARGRRTGTIASITDLTERKQNERTLRTLAALSHRLEQERSPAGVTECALDVLSQAIELSWLTLVRLEGDRFRPRAISGTVPPGLRDRLELGVARGEGAIWDTLGGEAVYLEESMIPAFVTMGVRSVALVPLPAAPQGVTQVLCAYRAGAARPWTAQERALMDAATHTLAAALDRAELHHQAQEAATFAQTLLAVSALVERELDPAVMAQQALELLAPAVDLDWGSLVIVRADGVELVSAWSREQGTVDPDRPLQCEQMSLAIHSGQSVYVDDHAGAPGRLPADFRSAAWIPLTTAQGAHYLYVVARLHGGRSWSPRDQDLLAAAARTMRVAFERQDHLRVMEAASLSDPLTGVGNRRALDRALQVLTEQGSGPFGLVSIDLDGLKRINDTLGHDWGDVLLREFGQALQDSGRAGDQIFRPGGDEFVVILPGCPPDQAGGALAMVDRAAERVRRRPELQSCGASAGVAFWPDDGPSGGDVVKTADERMYRQKRARHRSRHPT